MDETKEETKIERKGIDGLLEGIDVKRVLVFAQEPWHYGLTQNTATGIAYRLSRKGCNANVMVQVADERSGCYDSSYVVSFDDSGSTAQSPLNAFKILKDIMTKSVDAVVYVVGKRTNPRDIALNYKEFVDNLGVEKVFLCLDARETDSLTSTLDAIAEVSQTTGKDYTPKIVINTNYRDNERLMRDEAFLHH